MTRSASLAPASALHKLWAWMLVAFVGLAAALAWVPGLNLPAAVLSLSAQVALTALMLMGLVLLTGAAGLISFGQAAFAGLGAYSAVWIATWAGADAWVALGAALLVAPLLAAAVAAVLGLGMPQLGATGLILVSLAWALALPEVLAQWPPGGNAKGLAPWAAWSAGAASGGATEGPAAGSLRAMHALAWLVAGLAAWLVASLARTSPIRSLRAWRAGPGLADALGLSRSRAPLLTWLLAAMLAAVAGVLQAHLPGRMGPAQFSVTQGLGLTAAALLGGVGSVAGAFVGAVLFVAAGALGAVLAARTGADPSTLATVAVAAALLGWIVVRRRGTAVPRGLWPWAPAAPDPARARAEADAPGTAALATRSHATRGTPLLKAGPLSQVQDGQPVLQDVRLQVQAGEIFGVVGPLGSGKSALARLLLGQDTARKGSVSLAGRTITGADMARRLGLTPCRPDLPWVDGLTVGENVALGAARRLGSGPGRLMALWGRTAARQQAALWAEAERQLRFVGLADEALSASASLDYWGRRRLALARALATDPAVLVLDEMGAGLRTAERQALGDLLQALAADGLTIVLMEQEPGWAAHVADRLLVLDGGRVVGEGAPAAMLADPAVQAAMLGTRV